MRPASQPIETLFRPPPSLRARQRGRRAPATLLPVYAHRTECRFSSRSSGLASTGEPHYVVEHRPGSSHPDGDYHARFAPTVNRTPELPIMSSVKMCVTLANRALTA